MAKTVKELSEQIELLEKRIETIEKQYRTMFDIVQALNDKVDDIDKDLDDEQTYRIEMSENFDNCFDCLSEHVGDLLNANDKINDMMKDYKLTRAYVHTLVEFLNDIGVHIVIK